MIKSAIFCLVTTLKTTTFQSRFIQYVSFSLCVIIMNIVMVIILAVVRIFVLDQTIPCLLLQWIEQLSVFVWIQSNCLIPGLKISSRLFFKSTPGGNQFSLLPRSSFATCRLKVVASNTNLIQPAYVLFLSFESIKIYPKSLLNLPSVLKCNELKWFFPIIS